MMVKYVKWHAPCPSPFLWALLACFCAGRDLDAVLLFARLASRAIPSWPSVLSGEAFPRFALSATLNAIQQQHAGSRAVSARRFAS